MLRLQHIDHVAITVRDLKRSLDWYTSVLGLKRRFADVWGDVPTMVCAGDTCVALFPATSSEPKPPPDRDTLSMRHFAFRVDAQGFALAQARFREEGIPFTFEDHAVSHSIYIADPDGHRIEITTYET